MNRYFVPDNLKAGTARSKSKLAARYNLINLLFIIIILVITIVVASMMLGEMAESASIDYARSYTMESVDILSLHLNKEILLVQQASQAPELIDWFLDENDTQKKAAAFQKMELYARMQQLGSLSFAVSGSSNEYAINTGMTIDGFVPVNVLDPLDEYDRWFFTTTGSLFSFSMSTSAYRGSDAQYLWLNQKVAYNGETLGVISSALELDEIFHDIFGLYDRQNVMGFVIDHRGIIQMDSTVPMPEKGDTHILTMFTDVDIVSIINDEYLRIPSVYHGRRSEPEVMRLSDGDFRYMAIARVPNTNWLTITLFDSAALFDVNSILAPIFTVIIAFLVYLAASTMLNRKFVFEPLKKLTRSLSNQDGTGIYGTNRDDEIGILAQTTQTAINEREKQTLILQEAHNLQNTVNYAANLLLGSKIEEFIDDFHHCMGLLAFAVDVSRVRIWENHRIDGKLYCTQLYEWSQEAEPQHGSKYTVNISYDENIPGWEEILSKNDCINKIVSQMSETEQAQLTPQGILALLVVPVFLNNEFWGFVGFDNCQSEREFLEDTEVVILRSASLLFANALMRQEMNKDIRNTAAELEVAVKEAYKANESKTVFLANMSHEIRTPMNSIIGFSELALDYDMNPKLRDYFTNIQNNAEWLLQIINDILDISKIESGKMDMENIPFNLNDMFNSCRTLILPKAQEKGLTMYFYAEPSVGKGLYGDPTRLRQVLINLLSNAVKFTHNGMIKLQSAIKNIGKDFVTASFEVKDSGIGMTKEQIERIFSPFEQAESSITRKYGGTGLGLSITKSIIEMMGGTLAVESTPGVGSKFSFEITFDAVDADNADAIMDKIVFNELEKPTFEGEILLCEDNSMNQQVITEHLGRVGLKCVVADNGKIGVDLVKERKEKGEKQFDLIFMDMHMPVMDGLEAAAAIRDLKTGVPVVAMTANIMITDKDIYSNLGMYDCVGKPFTSQELWRCLMKYLKPVSWLKEDKKKREKTDKELRQKLIVNFVKNNSNIASDITNALDAGDITLAHRIAHTLKSNAGQLRKTALCEIAQEIENKLSDGQNLVSDEHMSTLRDELKIVLEEFAPIAHESMEQKGEQGRLDKAAAQELLSELALLLKQDDAECLSYVDRLRAVKGSEKLVMLIEAFEFKSAYEVLLALMEEKL